MVDENNSDEIESNICKFLTLQKEIKCKLKKDIESGGLNLFSDSQISKKYVDNIEMVV